MFSRLTKLKQRKLLYYALTYLTIKYTFPLIPWLPQGWTSFTVLMLMIVFNVYAMYKMKVQYDKTKSLVYNRIWQQIAFIMESISSALIMYYYTDVFEGWRESDIVIMIILSNLAHLNGLFIEPVKKENTDDI
ncbi:MAG: hypothetical protein DRG78_03725 [Epsilonproteobacteria bacterium]|nr:MAG: hypothetical protein DRG78_03725 [Campylobacterota bacterium]